MFRKCQCQDGGRVLKQYEWRCQGIKDALENLNTKEHIKKDSIRYLIEKFWKFWT